MDLAAGLWTLSGVVLGGVIAATTQAQTIRATRRSDRDARLWTKQSEVYLAVIEEIHDYSYSWDQMLWCDQKAAAIATHLHNLIQLDPQLRAFGSNEAGESYRLYLRSMSNVAQGAANLHDWIDAPREPLSPWIDIADADTDAIGETAQAHDEATKLGTVLVQEMRSDLGGDRPNRATRGVTSLRRRLGERRQEHRFARAGRRVQRHPAVEPEAPAVLVSGADDLASNDVPSQLDD
jgi:hypothetical protein